MISFACDLQSKRDNLQRLDDGETSEKNLSVMSGREVNRIELRLVGGTW